MYYSTVLEVRSWNESNEARIKVSAKLPSFCRLSGKMRSLSGCQHSLAPGFTPFQPLSVITPLSLTPTLLLPSFKDFGDYIEPTLTQDNFPIVRSLTYHICKVPFAIQCNIYASSGDQIWTSLGVGRSLFCLSQHPSYHLVLSVFLNECQSHSLTSLSCYHFPHD